jgi:hypothetical protein
MCQGAQAYRKIVSWGKTNVAPETNVLTAVLLKIKVFCLFVSWQKLNIYWQFIESSS